MTKKRLHLMVKMADYRQENQNKTMRITKYYKSDYIAVSLVKNLILTTIAYLVLLGIFVLYHMDFFLANLNDFKFGPLGMVLVILYLMMLGIYSVITYMIAKVQYLRANDEIQEYDRNLRRLSRMYDEEDRAASDPFGGQVL